MAFDTGRSQSSSTSEERSASNARQRGGSESAERTPASSLTSAARHYGLELESEGELRQLQRLERRFGVHRIQQWSSEGIPFDAMAHPDGIDTYRQSVQRSTDAASDSSPAGDTGVPDTVRDVISSQGRSLDPSIQRAMEERMGDSFGDVRVHTGPKAAQACDSIDARAFTVGNHVAFNHGEYDPSSPEGQHVLAHELAHVRQQTQGAVSMLPQEDAELEIDPDPSLEREAEETAQRVMQGGEVGIQRLQNTEVHVQRIFDGQKTLDAEDADEYLQEMEGSLDPRTRAHLEREAAAMASDIVEQGPVALQQGGPTVELDQEGNKKAKYYYAALSRELHEIGEELAASLDRTDAQLQSTVERLKEIGEEIEDNHGEASEIGEQQAERLLKEARTLAEERIHNQRAAESIEETLPFVEDNVELGSEEMAAMSRRGEFILNQLGKKTRGRIALTAAILVSSVPNASFAIKALGVTFLISEIYYHFSKYSQVREEGGTMTGAGEFEYKDRAREVDLQNLDEIDSLDDHELERE